MSAAAALTAAPGRRHFRRFARLLLAAGLILGFGFARVSWETELTIAQRQAGFGGSPLGLDLRDRLGQTGFLAALSGFRGIVADILCIQAYAAWERVEWGRMNGLFQSATTLQPKSVFIWDLAGWHMAYNASRAAREDTRQPREALRIRAERQYAVIGRDFLERGLQHNPTAPVLYANLGAILRDKLGDPVAASRVFEKGARQPGAPGYLKRFAAYALAQAPGHEREAQAKLRALYDLDPKEHLPTLLRELRRLEEKLSLPAEQRIYKP